MNTALLLIFSKSGLNKVALRVFYKKKRPVSLDRPLYLLEHKYFFFM